MGALFSKFFMVIIGIWIWGLLATLFIFQSITHFHTVQHLLHLLQLLQSHVCTATHAHAHHVQFCQNAFFFWVHFVIKIARHLSLELGPGFGIHASRWGAVEAHCAGSTFLSPLPLLLLFGM